ncbi:hypothetical protein BJ983_000089 [Actinomycetospora corticicola]|uniref:Uncharacterized protein n=1 Tax=Actinomycetospora corticicola TaxID=663602 RepID=A0A7Y9DR49_9PSEU|nr:hypothetical protein [Actinomycetospora corticicola]
MRRVEPVLAWVEPRSPDEDASRRRVRLLARGVPVPRVEQCLLDARGDVVARLALAWPEARTGIAVAPGVRDRARSIGWEVVTPAVGVTSDELVRWVTRSFDRWDPARRLGMPLTLRLPPAAEPDGVCDDGLSRLVPDCR